jgi:hypothetical protein
MCPGGTVVAATSEPGRVVTNGMSQYSRNEHNANAGIVVGIDARPPHPTPALYKALFGPVRLDTTDASGGFHPLGGVVLQRQWEGRALSWAVAAFQRTRANAWATSALAAPAPVWAGWSRRTNPACALAAWTALYAIDALREAIPAMARAVQRF